MAQRDINVMDDSRPPRARLKIVYANYEEYHVLVAASRGHLEKLKTLKQRGYDFNVVDWYTGDTAIHWAAYNNHLECFQWLLDNTTIPVDHRNNVCLY
ncbi:kinase D-interacting substrate of 220 kDa B-like [Dysidea avara]|uniref:kinase D-interacting substrate of 220 kDa B-like n=1 Tax=Dysidea avara TaxID=196820 RepID=UPI00331FFA72